MMAASSTLRRIAKRLLSPARQLAWRIHVGTQSATIGLRYWRPRPIRLENGARFIVDPRRRWIDWNLAVHGHYELGTLSLMRKFLNPGMTFLDVGANIGLMSVAAARSVGPEGQVFAFEPDRINFSRLVWARDANCLPNLLPLPFALGTQSARQRLHRSPNADGGLSTLKNRDGFVAGEDVPVATLDSLAEALGMKTIALIKIDAEGSELDVIKGGIRTIKREKPALIIEMINEDAVEAGRILIELGYASFATEGKGAGRADVLRRLGPQPLENDNMLFVYDEKCALLAAMGFAVQEY